MIELIADPRFEKLGTVTPGWEITCHAGVTISPQVRAGELALAIAGTNGANWQGALRYAPIAVEAGEEFRVEFEGRAERAFTFSVWLGQRDAPWASLVADENHFQEKTLLPTWQRFDHVWHPVIAEPNARLNFVLGQIDNRVEIRAVSLRKIPARPAA